VVVEGVRGGVLYKYKIGYGDYCMVPLLLPEAVMFGCCGGDLLAL
jgi:hypothetical protein